MGSLETERVRREDRKAYKCLKNRLRAYRLCVRESRKVACDLPRVGLKCQTKELKSYLAAMQEAVSVF